MKFILMLLTFGLISLSCSNDVGVAPNVDSEFTEQDSEEKTSNDSNDERETENSDEIYDYLSGQGHLEEDDYLIEKLSDSTLFDDYMEYTYKVDQNKTFPTLETFGQNSDILYVGSVLDGYVLTTEKNYSPLQFDINDIEISLSLETSIANSGSLGSSSLSTVVEDPSLSNVRDAIFKLVNDNAGNEIPISVEYSIEDIYSEDQLSIALGVPIPTPYLGDKLNLGFSDNTHKTKKVFKFKQKAFSVDMNTPKYLFKDDIDIDKLKDQLGDNGVPVYVSSVEYGSIIYVTIESELSETELSASLSVVSAGAGNKITEENTKISVLQYGGNEDYQEHIIESILSDGILNVKEMLEDQDLQTSKALPISYKLRYADNNDIAEIVIADEYTKTVYHKVNNTVTVSIDHFIWEGSDGAGNADLYTTCDVYAVSDGIKTKIATWNKSSDSAPYGWEQSPNKTGEFTFNNFDPKRDYIRVETYVKEDDFIGDDTGSKDQNFYYEDWFSPLELNILEGGGVDCTYTLSVEEI